METVIYQVYMFSATKKFPTTYLTRLHLLSCTGSVRCIALDLFSSGNFQKTQKKTHKNTKTTKKAQNVWLEEKRFSSSRIFHLNRAGTFCSVWLRKTCRAQRLAKNVFATHVYVCTMLLSVVETRLMTKGLNSEHRTPCDAKTRVARFSKAMLRKGLSVRIPHTGMSDAG
jgi:hypothetical protein